MGVPLRIKGIPMHLLKSNAFFLFGCDFASIPDLHTCETKAYSVNMYSRTNIYMHTKSRPWILVYRAKHYSPKCSGVTGPIACNTAVLKPV